MAQNVQAARPRRTPANSTDETRLNRAGKISENQRAALQRAARVYMVGSILLLVLFVVPAILGMVGGLFSGRARISDLLISLAALFLVQEYGRGFLRYVVALVADIREGRAQNDCGQSTVQVRWIPLTRPNGGRFIRLDRERLYRVGSTLAAQIQPGQMVCVYFAPNSRTVVSVERLGGR